MTDTKTTDTAIEATVTPAVTTEALAHLGEGHIAYVRAIRSEELNRLFPQAPKLDPGLDLFALLGADGTPIMVTDSRHVAVANAVEHDLVPVSVH